MANSQNEAENQQPTSTTSVGWRGKVEDRFQKIKEHAEAYPYVWASYILVYGGFGTWLGFRWRKLRNTEDRVRALQLKLQQLREAKNSISASSSSVGKPPTSGSSSVEKPSISASVVESSSQLAKKPPK